MTGAIIDPLRLEPGWRDALDDVLRGPAMCDLQDFLSAELDAGKVIYPPRDLWFAALNRTPIDQVRVVILGQDPYHGPDQAQGLSFSVRRGVRTPPSLAHIHREMATDMGVAAPTHGSLEHWASQGVLLLNSVLTVEQGRAGAHQGRGWEVFTDAIISVLNARPNPLAFILWGAYAQRKGAIIDTTRHLVITSAHPSPFAAHKGFLGSRPFSRVNDWLLAQGEQPMDWAIPA